ncbi:MAG: S8 family serine peptidase [bacterium]|nr:S8 family serine peptidase [bacterium]
MKRCIRLVFVSVVTLIAGTSAALDVSDRDVVSLRSGVIDLEQAALMRSSAPDADIQLVKFPGPVSSDQIAQLQLKADRVFAYLPYDTFLVRVAPSRAPSLVQSVGASWSAPWMPAYKISPEILQTRADDEETRQVMIHLFPDADVKAMVDQIEIMVGRGVEAYSEKTRFARVRVLLTGAEIDQLRQPLSEMSEVFWLERESRRVFLNDTTIWVGQSGTGGGDATPVFDQGLLGEGQIVGVLDTGIDIDSCYFRDASETPAINACDGGALVNLDHRKVLAVDFLWADECSGGIANTEWDTQDHGTHVAGTVAGDDLAQPGVHNGRDGMAPLAKLIVQDCGYQYNVCADCPGIGCPVIDLVPVFEQPYNQGARIHTNSWGDEEEDPNYGEYTSGSEDADTVMWNHKDYLLLFAAGNNGGTTNTVDSPSTAKSVISVGSTEHASNADTISGFSSRGPTDDGRIKPSITIVGSSVMSAENDDNVGTNNCGDRSMSGTSMASPGAAGLAALVREYFVDGFYPSGSEVPADGFAPSAALLRAALINSGEEMTGAGSIPNDIQGWGRILLDNVLFFSGDERKLWVADETSGFANGSSGENQVYELSVVGGGQPLEVTLAWTDYPSVAAANPTIINDLDLVVSGPDGTFYGNVFSSGQSNVGGSQDRINTLENVLIKVPTPGLWTITVTSFAVPNGPQPFALVATGDFMTCAGVGNAVAVAGTEVVSIATGDGDEFLDNCESATVGFSVANMGAAAASNVSIVSVSSPSHPSTVFATPSWTVASIDACDIDNTAYIEVVQAIGMSHDDVLLIDVEVTNAEIAPLTTAATLSISNTETDLVFQPLKSYDFETDLEGWTLQSGTFDRVDTLSAPSGSWYLQSSSDLADQCDAIRTPGIVLTETSTLSIHSRYEIEGGTPWFDRANVRVVDGESESVVEPDSGRFYDVEDGSANGSCNMAFDAGWAGSNTAWAVSNFSSTALGSADLAGREMSFEVRYGTDSGVHFDGFAFDLFEITNVMERVPDAQTDSCILGLIFADGFESGDTSRWSLP